MPNNLSKTELMNNIKDLELKLKTMESEYKSQIEALTNSLDEASKELEMATKALEETQNANSELIDIVEESVPKQKLRTETILERLNWYYRDLTGWSKIAAHVILFLVVVASILGIYFVLKNFSDNDYVMQIVSAVIVSVLGLFGISIQALALRTPKTN